MKKLWLVLLLPLLLAAKPVKYSELMNTAKAATFKGCTSLYAGNGKSYCYFRIDFFLLDPNGSLPWCVRIPNQAAAEGAEINILAYMLSPFQLAPHPFDGVLQL